MHGKMASAGRCQTQATVTAKALMLSFDVQRPQQHQLTLRYHHICDSNKQAASV
jgi:hypothetical protein